MTLSLAGRGVKPRELLAAIVQPAALCGLGAGLLFAFTAVLIKVGNRSLAGPSVFVGALFLLRAHVRDAGHLRRPGAETGGVLHVGHGLPT